MNATISAKGETTAIITVPDKVDSADVTLPVEKNSSGNVAVLIRENGNEEIITNSISTEDGVLITLTENATVKVIDNSKSFADTENHWASEFVNFVGSGK